METTCESEQPRRYQREAFAQWIEGVVAWHPDGGRWAHVPALIRAYPHPFFFVKPSTRIVDLLALNEADHDGP